jgi:peptidoglycan LD-endopeptidase LytH
VYKEFSLTEFFVNQDGDSMEHTKYFLRSKGNTRLGKWNHFLKNTIAGILLYAIVLVIVGFELQLLLSEILIQRIAVHQIDYEAFRDLKIGEDVLWKAQNQVEELKKKHPDLRNMPYVNEAGCLTFSMMAYSYDLSSSHLVDDKTFYRGISRLVQNPQFRELYSYYKAIFSNIEYFPVPKVTDQEADITYADSWYQPRTYGGNRKHEGTDLMASNNLRGFFPVISMTDGIVENKGWLEQGGYRIGIRSAAGGYFYYAHLYSYAPELKQGDEVIAGQLLGFMGDSGYGSEGTIGQFDVHLHLGIYVNTVDGEMSVNPYMVLKYLEKNRTVYSLQFSQ